MKLERVVQRGAEVELGQLCARSTRMVMPTAVEAPDVRDILELGRQLARGAEGAKELLDTVPRRNPSAVWHEVHGHPEHGGERQGVVHVCSGGTWILDAVQFAVFQAADGKRSLREILDPVTKKTGIDREAALIQVAEILGPEGSTLPLHRKPQLRK